MKKLGLIKFAFIGASIFLVVFSCRKTAVVKDSDTGYKGVHYINTSEVFPKHLGTPNLPGDNLLTEEGVYLGRLLFYDPMLSEDSTISCVSCHDQKHAFADPNTFSTGINGLKTGRNSPGLFNLAYNTRFFWDARQKTLREQVLEPIQAHNEMGMTLNKLLPKLKRTPRYQTWFKKAFNAEPSIGLMAKAMEQFMLQLVSAGSRFDEFFTSNGKKGNFTADELAGFLFFSNLATLTATGTTAGDCQHCHSVPLTQNASPSIGLSNNGLDSVFKDKGVAGITGLASDLGKFKVFPVRNIALTAPYMHDGRFTTLEQVIDHYSDKVLLNTPTLASILIHEDPVTKKPRNFQFTADQKRQLLAFFNTLTDYKFINNPAYSSPYN